MSLHIHRPDDGRGRRRVLVDGKEMKRVIYADTLIGLVRYYEDPIRLIGDKPVEHETRGRVEVELING